MYVRYFSGNYRAPLSQRPWVAENLRTLFSLPIAPNLKSHGCEDATVQKSNVHMV